MLLNFCDKCLRTDITCSTISTEGYEVTNLVNNSNQGFLAYYAIKPPVHIDFVFLCNIKISNIIIWPRIGAQKSSGFQLSVKSTNVKNEPFTDVSKAFIKTEESGVFFYRQDGQNNSEVFAPPNFAQRYIKSLNITNFVSSLRISILKTENSVPGLGKVEIWGQVSPRCGKDVVSNVMALWTNSLNNKLTNKTVSNNSVNNIKPVEKRKRKLTDEIILNVPEDFLDSITCELMTQPIILPSGKIIDQKTLEKHGQNEAVWGRPVSDPFTGIRFSDTVKPIAALPLKARIDQFLLENSNQDEIKKLPRVLGSTGQKVKCTEVIMCSNQDSIDDDCLIISNQEKTIRLKETISVICEETLSDGNSKPSARSSQALDSSIKLNKLSCSKPNPVNDIEITQNVNFLKRTVNSTESCSARGKKSSHSHLLPLVVPNNFKFRSKNVIKTSSIVLSKKEILRNNALIEKKLDSSTRINIEPECKCCTSNIFYQLPCKHVICRKALISLKKNQCTVCKMEFQTSDPQRFHLST